MAVCHSDKGTPRSAVHEGAVCVIGGQGQEGRYLKAYCIGTDGQPAQLVVFENSKHAGKGKPVIRVIQFSEVENISSSDINKHQKLIVKIKVCNADDFLFCVESEDDHAKWLGYCNVLFTLSNYVIPEIPKRSLVSQECASRYTDPSKFGAVKIFVVYLINEGVSSILGLSGLHIITIKENDATFNIYAYHTEKHLVSWDQDKIRRSGCIESLVFIEPGRNCYGGPGLLWMYCPPSSKLRKILHNFLNPDLKRSILCTSIEPVSVDQELSSTYLTSSDSRQLLQKPTDQSVLTMTSCGKHNDYVQESDCNSSEPLCGRPLRNKLGFRSRSEVISKSEGNTFKQSESYSKLKSKKVSQQSQNATGTETSDTQEPPPLPPKPKKLANMSPKDRVVAFTSSESSVTSVYQRTQPLSSKSSHSLPSSSQTTSKRKVEASSVFKEYALTIISKLDIDTITPHLYSRNLLTQKDHQFLLNKSQTDHDKVQYLLYKLPRKAEGWFESFLECLHDSEEGTGHKDIAKTLEAAKLQGIKDQSGLNDVSLLTVPVQVSSDTDKSYPVFIDSQCSNTVGTLQVLPSETVELLMARIRKKFNISPSKALKMEMMDFPLCREKSIRESRIFRYSYITVHVLTDT